MKTDKNMHLGARIRHARKLKEWGQVKLAEELGVSQQAVSQWEKGETVSPRLLHEVAYKLDVSYEWLAFNEGSITGEKTPWHFLADRIARINRDRTNDLAFLEDEFELIMKKIERAEQKA